VFLMLLTDSSRLVSSSTLNMEAICSSETSDDFQRTLQSDIRYSVTPELKVIPDQENKSFNILQPVPHITTSLRVKKTKPE
jgi:hypothetical protein